jgi:murein L,D-transpeptidase YcbB/YkuD
MARRVRTVRHVNAAGLSRRIVLRHLAGIAAFAGMRSALADDRALDALMGDTDHGGFDQGFDQASRTVHMPKATIPMLSPGTAEATRRAVEAYDGIVARGGWPEVSKVLELRLGTNHPSVGELRARLTISSDLDPHASAVENDIYDSYLEEAVRRFQAVTD